MSVDSGDNEIISLGLQTSALSMPHGHVYFQTGVLEEAAKKLCKDDLDISLMDSDRKFKGNDLYSLSAIYEGKRTPSKGGLIRDSYLGGQFVVRIGYGKEHGFYYAPFNAEAIAFGKAVSYFEGMKTGKIKETAEDVAERLPLISTSITSGKLRKPSLVAINTTDKISAWSYKKVEKKAN